jgi:hypothetical protein
MTIAVLGTYEFDAHSRDVQQMFMAAITRIALARITIRTGASRGCDQIAAMSALEVGGRVELVLPWSKFEARWVDWIRTRHGDRVTIEVFDPKRHLRWRESVHEFQYDGEILIGWTWRQYARVYGIVEPCDLVVALTMDSERGGTGQGIRIGRAHGKVVVDMRKPEDRTYLLNWLKGLLY